MIKHNLHLLGLLLALVLTACGRTDQPSAQVALAPIATVPFPTPQAASELEPVQGAATPAALALPCAELVPGEELERMIGTRPDNLLETVRPGWTACMWFYTPPGATQQAEFTVQAYTGEETLVKWRMDTANAPSEVVVNSLADYVPEGYTWVIPESKLRAVQALQDGRYVFLRFPAENLALNTESQIADYLAVLFQRLEEMGG